MNMNHPRIFVLLALMALSVATQAQSVQPQKPPPSEAQKSFEALKTLTGSWEGPVSGVPGATDVEGKLAKVSLRVTSMGNALMHEMRVGERPDDPITGIGLEWWPRYRRTEKQ